MKIQLAIVHYFNPAGGGRHGSLSPDPAPRAAALRQVILQLHRLFGKQAGSLNHMQRRLDGVNDGGCELSINICVTGEQHLLSELADLQATGAFNTVASEPADPKHLGFCCHRILKQQYNSYDYSCYLEDDLLITDADFFLKLQHFNRCFGNYYLLQPNRIETSEDLKHLNRFYIDGDYNPAASAAYRQSMAESLCLEHLGRAIRFRQPLNTHSGCFFLNKSQAATYFQGPHWQEEDVSFHSPLESAATLGVMKQFQIMKPVLDNGQFLTVEHAGRNFMGLLTPVPAEAS